MGSLRDELFAHALLSPGVCESTSAGIPSMVDVLEFGPGRIPPVLWDTAVRRLGEGTALPARDKQFIYALVFPRLEEARPESTSDQREIMHGMLTALARAHHVGIINVDLRENHTLYDRSDGSYRLIDWDCTTTVAAAAGQDPLGPRNDSRRCVVDQPAVPVNFWGEGLRGKQMTAAPEMLFPWRDGSAKGCRFTPAIDIWHAGLLLAKALGCKVDLMPQRLQGVAAANRKAHGPSIISSLANVFGTDAMYKMLDRYGWKLGSSCKSICTPAPSPLNFDPKVISSCERQCGNRMAVHPDIAARTASVPAQLLNNCDVSMQTPEIARGLRLASQMLALDPADRITANTALQHEFFTSASRSSSSDPRQGPAPPKPAHAGCAVNDELRRNQMLWDNPWDLRTRFFG